MRGFLLYIFLVGLPLVALLAIFHIGERLQPPYSVEGSWQLHVDPAAIKLLDCPPLASTGASDLRLHISQSGPHLSLALEGLKSTRVVGEIVGTRIKSSLPAARAAAEQPDTGAPARLVAVEAQLDRDSPNHSLSGTLTLLSCNNPVPFTARPYRPTAGGAGSN